MWPENWESLVLFMKCASKWDMVSVGMGGVLYLGLNDARIQQVMSVMGVTNRKRALDDLLVMEAEAKRVLNAKINRGGS